MSTPILGLLTTPQGATDISVAYNDAVQLIDALLPLVIQDKDLSSPPTTTTTDLGKRWIIGPSPTGAWSGQANKIALCTSAGVWRFISPPLYITAYIIDEAVDYRWGGASWAPV